MSIEQKELTVGNQHIFYDASLDGIALTAWPYLFDDEFLRQHRHITDVAHGRGETWFFEYGGHKMVLRHYRRGGVIGKFNPDYYLRTSLTMSRPWREWKLLNELYDMGLPVPRPAGVRLMQGSLFYVADLVTHQLEDVTPLSQQLQATALDENQWKAIGRLIKRFHDKGVYHDDLNAHNILLRGDEMFIIDFDKGDIRQGGRWKKGNLQRLQRSLKKLAGLNDVFHFDGDSWRALVEGYQG